MSSGLTGASYTNTFVYTHLGQLWQGPLNGSSTSYQYLYCGSAPHQLSGLYSTGTTCANKASAVYQSSSNTWSDVTGRTYPSATSVTLAYNSLDQFVRWTTGTGSNEFYAYDASGNRVLRRSTSGGTTTMTVYAFGLEEHLYSGTGTSQGNTYYYSLAGRLIGELTGTTPKTNIFLTDPLGSVLATFSNTAGVAALLGNQVYGPYGTQRYSSGGTMGTNKGFTGQYNDTVTGLDYYNARYYDPVVGVFLAVVTVQP
jgi:YD repeat-containing protein